MTSDRPGTTSWVADGSIELTEGETLGGLWVSTTGLLSSIIATEQDPPPAQVPLLMQWQPRVMRLGVLWTDNPITIVDPLSSLADVLWLSSTQWEWRVVSYTYPDPLGEVFSWSHVVWYASHNTPNQKVEGQRLVPPGQTRYITFNGSEAGAPGSPLLLSTQTVMHAVVSALVLLPEEP